MLYCTTLVLIEMLIIFIVTSKLECLVVVIIVVIIRVKINHLEINQSSHNARLLYLFLL